MKSKVHIKKVESYSIDKIELFIHEALSIIDKKGSLFSTGQKVLLKPNLLRGFSPEHCVTTHPKVIEAMCRVLKDYSIGQITISDKSQYILYDSKIGNIIEDFGGNAKANPFAL